MLRLLYFVAASLSLANILHATSNQTCPTVPNQCQCTHKNNGFRIFCLELEAVSFASLPGDIVVDIYLSSNNLREINASTFPHPNNIRKLTIKNNALTTIGDGTFQGFNNLKKLDLSKNYLIEIKRGTFEGLDNTTLTLLDLSENRILKISTKAFMNMKVSHLKLNGQKNLANKPADLISYSDFLSRSLVKKISLSNNDLLCDCNQEWLLNWLEDQSHRIEGATCYYPLSLRGTSIVDLFSEENWNCSAHDAEFSLPNFHLFPDNNQVLIEGDRFEMYCYSTWVQQSTISWLRNGIKLKNGDLHVNITPSSNLTKGSSSSTLVITKLALNDSGTITCQVKVRYSGSVSVSRDVRVLGASGDVCEPTVSSSDRGSIKWPTALDGAVLRMTCPHGSVDKKFAHYSCSNGTWSSLEMENCLFDNQFTRKMQTFYYEAKSHDRSRIKRMLKDFFKTFPSGLKLIKTKYDLYFLSKMLEEIMNMYEGRDGVTKYSDFLWKAVGMLVDHHNRYSTMKEVVYGLTSGRRYRNLLERFVFEQIQLRQYGTQLVLSAHEGMGANSVSQPRQAINNAFSCYVVPGGLNLETSCGTVVNRTAYQMSSISLSVEFGKKVKLMRVTLFSFTTSAFFQSEVNKLGPLQKLSPIVGLKVNAKNMDGTATTTVSGVKFHFSNEYTKFENAELVYWLSHSGTDEDGEWKKVTWCFLATANPLAYGQKDVTQYECPYLSTPNVTYFALLGKLPTPVDRRANYLEVIVYIMACVASVFILSTLIVFAYFSYFSQLLYNRSDAATLMNLCLALLITEIIFACGIHRTDDPLLCKGVAVALQYFLMCALVWLACGGIVLLRLVKKKDRANVNAHDPVLKYYLVGWGIPLILCSITVAYNGDEYGTTNNCWIKKKASIGGFFVPAVAILLADLAIFLYLHSVINRLFPEPLEGENGGDTSDEDEDENCNTEECHVNKCRYKIQPRRYAVSEFRFPKRRELISYLYGNLLVLLLLCLTFTCVAMIYLYQDHKAVYLYKFFSYGSAVCNLLIGVTIFYYNCIKRRDIMKHLLLTLHNIRHKPDYATAVEPETLVLIDRDGESHVDEHLREEKFSAHAHDVIDTHGVYGMSDNVVSDGSNIMAVVRVESCKTYEGRGVSPDDPEQATVERLLERSSPVPSDLKPSALPESLESPESVPPTERRAPMSHSELSDQDKRSNTHDSIGECSLASSRPKRPPKNIQIPSNLKDFVPENWRPARRRTNKGASYYPYYISENNPISASLAYSSKSSSLASTTVSGVPLYLNKNRVPNGANVPHMNRLGPSPIRPHPSAMGPGRSMPPMLFPNMPMRYQPHPSYRGPAPQPANPNMTMHPVPREVTHTPYTGESETERSFFEPDGFETDMNLNTNGSFENEPNLDRGSDLGSLDDTHENIEEVAQSVEPSSESEEEIPYVPVAPDLYIPMPHVSIKQFTLRSETSV